MAQQTAIYNNFAAELLKGDIDLESDTIKLALVTDSYTLNPDTHTHFDDITNEVTGTGYTAGGITISNITVTVDNTDDKAYISADSPERDSVTFDTPARAAILYKDTGTASTSALIMVIAFAADQDPQDVDYVINWDPDGIFEITVPDPVSPL